MKALMRSPVAAVFVLALALTPKLASAGELYMCEIVNGDSFQLVSTVDANQLISTGFHLLTHTDELTHKISIKIYKDVHPDWRTHEPRIHFDALIDQGPDARPILFPLGPVTMECKNQNPDALTWSLNGLKFAARMHGALDEKVDADGMGLKPTIAENPALDSTQLSGVTSDQKIPAN